MQKMKGVSAVESVRTGIAGTLESSDIMITLELEKKGGAVVELDSAVEKQFGRQIRDTIVDTLTEIGITDYKVTAVDRGALDCIIRARVKAAADRALGVETYNWEAAIK